MKRYSFLIALIILMGSLTGCKDALIGDPVPNTILNNFDVFGEDFQNKYGGFKVKPNIDWPVLLKKYRAELEKDQTEAGLYEALTGLITELNDSHLFLWTPDRNLPFFEGGISGVLERQEYKDFDFQLVLSKYATIVDSVSDRIYYGTLKDNIGYIHLPEIYDIPSFFEDYMPKLIEDLKDTKGIVLDIRDNNGGEDESSRKIASFFAESRTLYMISRYKVGPGPDDFEEPRKWFVDPHEGEKYQKQIVLLTNRYSVSAAETFSLAMKSLPQVIQVGDTTTGAFSDVVDRQLPNSWLYGLSVGDYRDGNDVSFEGIGLPPDVRIVNTSQDLASGVDRMLEAAMEELK